MSFHLNICFSEKDKSLAYYIKAYLGYGSVSNIKDKKAVKLVVSHSKGLIKIVSLVNGKLRLISKINQLNDKLIPYLNNLKCHKDLNFKLDNVTIDNTSNLNNHWLAGFSDADASFQIKILKRQITKQNLTKLEKKSSLKLFSVPSEIKSVSRTEIRLNFQIDLKTPEILYLIKEKFGGNIGYRQTQNTYYYGSTSFTVAQNFIDYFNKYHLLSSKHISYIKWRKVYLMIQNKEHLTIDGIEKIKKIKSTLN